MSFPSLWIYTFEQIKTELTRKGIQEKSKYKYKFIYVDVYTKPGGTEPASLCNSSPDIIEHNSEKNWKYLWLKDLSVMETHCSQNTTKNY